MFEIVIFSLIVIIFGLIPAYFYIKNYDKNMQKYREYKARQKAQGLTKYIKFIILLDIILVIFTISIGYYLNRDLDLYTITPIVFIIFAAISEWKIILHFILIFYLFVLWNDKLVLEFISKVF
ncbi:hypothetical protein H0A43_04195 [Arcobacter lanthieri]|uniref:hypothetical protein n=1 Tax=Aliarcobacter lanthieri TaxID=1355374 RepID=UPI0019237155|nr:hypothetical protein [Aliarcobacter lanthieri]MBL3519661.1 hypothetical protein [Aliarcobacter lanthieri]